MVKNGGNGGRYSHADLRPKKWRENGGEMAAMPDIPDAGTPERGCRRESMRMVPEKAMAARRYVVLNRWGRWGAVMARRHIAMGRKSQWLYMPMITGSYADMITGLIIP